MNQTLKTINRDAIEMLMVLQSPEQPDFVGELITLWLKETPPKIAEIEAGLVTEDFRRVGKAAHHLKSSSRTLGAEVFGLICQELEELAQSSPAQIDSSIFGRLKNEFASVQKEFALVRQEIKSNS